MKTISTQLYFLIVIIIVILLSGCTASMHYINDGAKIYPAINPESVLIVSERTIENKDFVEIGYVAINITNANNGDQLKNAMKEEAASIGADAVIDFRIFGLTAGGIAVKYK